MRVKSLLSYFFLEGLLILAFLIAATKAMASEYSVRGAGVARRDYGTCVRDLEQLSLALKAAGLKLASPPACFTEGEAFYPRFEAISNEKVLVQELRGARFSTESFCETDRLDLIERSSERILESACVENGGVYQAVLVTLVANEGSVPAKTYSSIESLVSTVDQKRTALLYNR